jgi:hypothetical protein
MPFLLAAVLALDQRIELQLPLMVLLAVVAARKLPPGTWQPGKAVLALLFAAGYLAVNSVVTLTDTPGVSDLWWAAPVRVWLYYVLLIAMATVLDARRFDGDSVFQVLEWLFLAKVLIVAVEGYVLWQTGEPRERPLFNIVLDTDTLFGVRFTSSYDFLFALLAVSPRHRVRRMSLLVVAVLVSETRALLLLSLIMLAWRLWSIRSPWVVLASAAAPVIAAIAVVTSLGAGTESSPRLLQTTGSSVDDKLEQLDAVSGLIVSPYLLTGRGLGVSMPGIVRDDLRPYSYEVQTPLLLWQGGLLFFAFHLAIVCAYIKRRRVAAILLVLGLGFLNPTLFSLASAFFLTAFGKALGPPNDSARHPVRDTGLHTQRPGAS